MVASIRIVATPKGLKVEGDGFAGQACSLDMAKILTALNISPAEAEPKPEFYLNKTQSNHEQTHQG